MLEILRGINYKCEEVPLSIEVCKIFLICYYFLQLCEWILQRSSFQLDVMCFNLLIDAYGQKSLYKKAESTYLELLEARCVPTEDTYALLIKAYCTAGLQQKAEAVFAEMRKHGLPPSMSASNIVLLYFM